MHSAEQPVFTSSCALRALPKAKKRLTFYSVQLHSKRGETDGPVAIHTRLGWVLSGPVNNPTEITRQESPVNISATHVLKIEAHIYQESEPKDIKSKLSKFWDLETISTLVPITNFR